MATPAHPLERLWQRLARGEAVVAGVLSGTSADAIDVVLVRAGEHGPGEPLAFGMRPFPTYLADELRAILDGKPVGARDLAFLTRDLGRTFGRAARALADEQHLSLDLVGSHGQTIYHHDGADAAGAATLQLGDGDFVARAAGALCVSDFRMADLAAGGEGAPLSALVDPELFPQVPRPCAILNLGGIANVTYLADGEPPLAFDVGPANALLDGLARALLGQPFDRDGAVAASGTLHPELLAELLAHPYFDRRPPKSTGRDTFGAAYTSRVLARSQALRLAREDVLASAVALVGEATSRALLRFLPARPRELLLCGGGARHQALVRELGRRTGLPTASTAAHGVDPDAREALFFARLAVRCVLARPSTEPRVSGARPGGILGKISFPGLDPAGFGPASP